MDDEILEQKEWSLADYLALFDPDAPDTAYVRERSDRIESIMVKKLRSPSGQIFEDTTIKEKAGASYTIRTRL